MDTQWSQSAQNVDYYVPANISDTAMIQAQATQSTETTQGGIHVEDFIGLDDTAAVSNLSYTGGPFTQHQEGVDSSTSVRGSWSMDPTPDIFHSSEDISENQISTNAETSNENSSRAENMLQNHVSYQGAPSSCTIVDSQRWQIMPSFLKLSNRFHLLIPLRRLFFRVPPCLNSQLLRVHLPAA